MFCYSREAGSPLRSESKSHLTSYLWFALPCLLSIPLATGAAGASEAKGVAVEICNLMNQPSTNVPVTFGQVFRKGHVAAGRHVRGLLDDRPVQVDEKRHYDDGSLRFAIISAIIPQLAAEGSRRLILDNAESSSSPPKPPISVGDLLETDFDALVRFTFPDGAVRSISARRLLEDSGGQATTWLHGDTATEWLLAGPPTGPDGRSDDDLEVRFQVRAYAGCRLVRVSMAIENCSDHWAGNIRYDVRVQMGGEEVFSVAAVDHRPLSRWRKTFWWGGAEPAVHVVHDLATLSGCGALPNYDRTLQPADWNPETRRYLDMHSPDWQILSRGSLVAYMGTTGGRMEIAPYPTWTVQYLLTMTPETKSVVLAHGDLAGSWPIHVRARQTGRILKIDDRPQFWLDSRGKDRPEWQPDRHKPDAAQVKLTPDIAHQPSLAYVPYLVTGDYYFLEEAYFWANYCLLSTWPTPRRDARGLLGGQIRGDAWGLRNIADAAWIAPDYDPDGAYLDEKVRNNIAHRIAKMYGPPEYNSTGAWGVRTVADARIQNPANPNWMITAPWEEDYLLWSLHHLVELGYPDAARPRDFLLRMRVGLLTHAPDYDPMLATPYRLVVGEKTADNQVVFYEDWRRLGLENARLSKPELPNYGNSYAYSARAAVVCGIDGDFPRAREALQWLENHLPNHRKVMAENPVWAIVPREDR